MPYNRKEESISTINPSVILPLFPIIKNLNTHTHTHLEPHFMQSVSSGGGLVCCHSRAEATGPLAQGCDDSTAICVPLSHSPFCSQCLKGIPGLCFRLVSDVFDIYLVSYALRLLLVHCWHVLPFPVNSPSQEVSLYTAHSCSLSLSLPISLSLCLDVLLCVTQWVSFFLVCFFF